MLVLLVEHGRVVDPECALAYIREMRALRSKARLAAIRRLGDNARLAVVVAHNDARRVPGHVGQRPLVPSELPAIRGPRRIPRVIRMGDALWPLRAVERHGHDIARILALDPAGDLTARRHHGRE